jgi:hypothetical protein
MAVYEWYKVTNKDDAADYEKSALISLENIRKSVSKRSRPTPPASRGTEATVIADKA